MSSSNSLGFPFVSRYLASTAKNGGKVWFFLPAGPSLTTPPGKGPRVCEGPELERITGRQQGVTRCSCHLPPSSLRFHRSVWSVATTNYSQSIRCCEAWRLLCSLPTLRFFLSIGNLASQPAGSGNAGTQSWAQFGSKDKGSSCNLVSRWMEGCRVGLYLHGCGESTLHYKHPTSAGAETEARVCVHTLWMSYVKVLVCPLLRSVLGVLGH